MYRLEAREPIKWPPMFLDLVPLDFFYGDIKKSSLHEQTQYFRRLKTRIHHEMTPEYREFRQLSLPPAGFVSDSDRETV